MEADVPQQICDALMEELAPVNREIYHQFDRAITDFPIPISICSYDEYDQTIINKLTHYVEYINSKPALRKVQDLLKNVKTVCDHITDAIQEERCGNTSTAQGHILNILNEFKEDPFFVSDMDKSYAFRGSAPFKELWSPLCDADDYKEQLSEPLSFYRCRVGKVDKREEMLHIPLTMRSKIGTNRFSLPGIPCLYLSTSSYCCWKELGSPRQISVSGFRLTEAGKKRKILNLVFPQSLINGSGALATFNPLPENVRRMMILFPVVMATYVTVETSESSDLCPYKPNYTISHLIMRCLKELGIDGVAYLSARSASEFEYPCCVNLALPVFSPSLTKKVGEICESFEMTDPICCSYNQAIGDKSVKKSYFNTIYTSGVHSKIRLAGVDIPYRKTSFAHIDNELMGKPFFPIISG